MRVSAAALPSVVTVGDPFRVVVRVSGAARVAAELAAPDTNAVQANGAVTVEPPEARHPDHLVVVPLVAWRTGTLPAVEARLRLEGPDGVPRTMSFRLPLPRVASVLPRDTAGVEPKGPKDVLDEPVRRAVPDWWPYVLGALGLLALLAWLARRLLARRREGPPLDPHATALAALALARSSADREEARATYGRLSGALRALLAARDPAWGRDRTTAEVVSALIAGGADREAVAELALLLARADVVKFAGAPRTPAEAAEDVDAARRWVEARDPAALRPLPTAVVDAGKEAA